MEFFHNQLSVHRVLSGLVNESIGGGCRGGSGGHEAGGARHSRFIYPGT